MAVLQVAYNVILPIFLILGGAVLVGRQIDPSPRPLSTVLIYLCNPALILDGIATSDLRPAELWQIAVFSCIMTLLMWLVGWGAARVLGLDRPTRSAFLLTVILTNVGNYGIPLSELAFGPSGAQRAMVHTVVMGVISNTVGVYLASSGTASTRQAFINVAKVPLPYAALLGLALNLGGAALPAPLGQAVALLAAASVPGMLVLLGLQIAHTSVRGRLLSILAAAGARLLVAPLLAFPVAGALNLEGLTRKVSLVEASMPTAVMSVALATEFDSDATFISAVILVSTLASVVTLSLLLTVLM